MLHALPALLLYAKCIGIVLYVITVIVCAMVHERIESCGEILDIVIVSAMLLEMIVMWRDTGYCHCECNAA